jgi:hypothetical protein
MCSDTTMNKQLLFAAASVVTVGIALAQVEASSSTYLLDVDTARYVGPASQRLMLRVGDQPRHIAIGTQDEICVQLQRVAGNSEVISARIRALRPQPRDAADVRLVGPDISPGTYRSTPWGMPLRALPDKTDNIGMSKAVGTESAPTCTL